MKTNNLEGRINHRRKQRKYNGNPLAYFRAHPKKFEKYKNRTQLFKGDSGIYRALGRAGQLEEAYPEANVLFVERGRKLGKGELSLSLKDKKIIVKAYKPNKGNVLEASRHLPYSASTIWRCWKKEGLDARGRRKNLTKSDKKKVLQAYKPSRGNANKASKDLFYSVDTIIRCWRNAGFEIRGRGGQVTQSEEEKINNSYDSSGGNACRVSKELHHAISTIIRHWRNAGFEIRKVGRPKTI